MSIYKAKSKAGKLKSPFWQYDFKVKVGGKGQAQRFYGSTGQKGRRAAEAVEANLRELAALGQLSSIMTVYQACERYWREVGKAERSARDEAKNLEYISRFIGAETLLVSITPEMVADAAAERANTPIERMQGTGKAKQMAPTGKLPAPATVNRQLIEPLRRLLVRAKKVWRVPIDLEGFDWGL